MGVSCFPVSTASASSIAASYNILVIFISYRLSKKKYIFFTLPLDKPTDRYYHIDMIKKQTERQIKKGGKNAKHYQ
jgi:hypothetical protein